jgi:hypothetical protein
VTFKPPIKGDPGNVKVPPELLTTMLAIPTAAADRFTVQFNVVAGLELPVQDAVKVLLPCWKRTLVAQLAAVLLHVRFVPVTTKLKLEAPLLLLTSSGVRVRTLGNEDEVENISRTFCR